MLRIKAGHWTRASATFVCDDDLLADRDVGTVPVIRVYLVLILSNVIHKAHEINVWCGADGRLFITLHLTLFVEVAGEVDQKIVQGIAVGPANVSVKCCMHAIREKVAWAEATMYTV